MKASNESGICYWITGLSGAGKTTISLELVKLMRKNHKNVVFLDGDNLRNIFKNKNYSLSERLSLSYQYSSMTKLLSDQGIHVVIAVMALFHEIHQWNRKHISNYVEVFLDVSLTELERRDPKGLYKNYRLGKISGMAGLDLKADLPIKPDFYFDWNENKNIVDISNTLFNDFQNRIKNDL